MNKQTAVEWLENIIKVGLTYDQELLFQSTFEQAKAMEKEMIIKSNRDGIDMVVNKENFITGEQYYNETYGK